MIKIKTKLEEISSKLDITNFLPGYFINKNFFRAGFIFLIIIFLVMIQKYGFSEQFIYCCPSDAQAGFCVNPFYYDCKDYYGCADSSYLPLKYSWLEDVETVPAGVCYGEEPSWVYDNFVLIIFVMFTTIFLLNHFLYNRGYFKEKKGGE